MYLYKMKITRNALKKLESVFEELSYNVLYEKGNFKSGYCIVKDKKVIVINKYYDVEARFNCLLVIFDEAGIDISTLSKAAQKTLHSFTKP